MDVSPITDYMYLGARPHQDEARALGDLGIRLVISMIHDHFWRGLSREPFTYIRLATIDSPLTPIPVKTLYKGVLIAQAVVKRGEKLLVYCKFGRHRSAAMAASILISQGFSAEEAMKLIKRQRPTADPQIWYIRRQIEKFEAYWANSPR